MDSIFLIQETFVSGEDYNGRDYYDERLLDGVGFFTEREAAEQFIADYRKAEQNAYNERTADKREQIATWETRCAEIDREYAEIVALAKDKGLTFTSMSKPLKPPKPSKPLFEPTELEVIELERQQ